MKTSTKKSNLKSTKKKQGKRTRKTMSQEPSRKTKFMSVLAMLMLLFLVGLGVYAATRPVQKEATIITSNGARTSLTSGECAVNSMLVSPCRPLIGAISADYPGASGWESNINAFETRAGLRTDVAHNYHNADSTSLTPGEVQIAQRGTILYLNWKPDLYWRNVNGRNAAVNARIDAMAHSIKALGSKVFLTIYHEPEDNISAGGSSCTRHKDGNAGTAAEYRTMWRTVRQRFDAIGVKNVEWVMNYMGWSGWDCAVKDLWPGNNLVDWVTWDPYTDDSSTFMKDMTRFSTFLTENTDATHAFTSKLWGIGEMGYIGNDQQKAYNYYDDMATAILNNSLPRIHMYLFFDQKGLWDSRIGYTTSGRQDSTEQNHFNSMFQHVVSLKAASKQSDVQAPKVTLNTLAPKKTVSGVVSFNVSASDNLKVKVVSARVDDKWFMSDFDAPYDFKIDTHKLANGKHTIFFRAWDFSDNHSQTSKITLTIKN